MESLPKVPTEESVNAVLFMLGGTAEQIAHVEQYIEILQKQIVELQYQVDHTGLVFNPHSMSPDTKTIDANQLENSDKYKILIIDDDLSINVMIKTIVENAGYIALCAEAGYEGIELAIDHIPDLIICDIHLPGMHGIDVIRAFKASAELEMIPIIMLTADLFKGDESLALGANEYLLKPIRKNQLMSYIHKYLPAVK